MNLAGQNSKFYVRNINTNDRYKLKGGLEGCRVKGINNELKLGGGQRRLKLVYSGIPCVGLFQSVVFRCPVLVRYYFLFY